MAAEVIVPSGVGQPLGLAGFPLDRAAHLRHDDAWVAERLGNPATRLLPFWSGKNLLAGNPPRRAVALPPDRCPGGTADPEATIFLGTENNVAWFGLRIAEETEAKQVAAETRARFHPLKAVAGMLAPRDAALLACLRALAVWHDANRHCGTCGRPTRNARAGHARRCSGDACGAWLFPRVDPAVIVRVTHGELCLLGRQRGWAPGFHSVLAGFVEPGETLEEAVAREVLEETGVRVAEPRYHASQPWPFPGSLMVAFAAEALGTSLDVDRDELESALWVSRAELRDGLASGALRLPPPVSVAYALIEAWFDRGGQPLRRLIAEDGA